MNMAPLVNAGDDVEAWLADGPRAVQLDGIVSDEDGGPGPAMLVWTVIGDKRQSSVEFAIFPVFGFSDSYAILMSGVLTCSV